MSYGNQTTAAPERPGAAIPPTGFLTLDYAETAAPGRRPPQVTAPAFLPPPDIGTAGTRPGSSGGPGNPAMPPRRRLGQRKRRMIELVALIMLVPLTLGLQWFDAKRLIGVFLEPEETITVVPRNGTAVMAHSRWTMGGRLPDSPNRPTGGAKPAGATTITLIIGVKALDQQGAKEASSLNLKFRLVDRNGNEWAATAEYKHNNESFVTNPPVGQPIPIHVEAEVPAHLAGQLVLDVVQSGAYRPKGPLRVLRFAH